MPNQSPDAGLHAFLQAEPKSFVPPRLNDSTDPAKTALLEGLGKLAGVVAHELNNLTTVIQGHTKLLLAGHQLSSELAHSLLQIDSAASRAVALADQLRLFGSEQIVQTLPLDLNAFIAARRQLLQKQLGPEREFKWEPSEDPVLIEGDIEILEQIVRDLPVAARQSSRAGQTIVFRTYLRPENAPDQEQSFASQEIAGLEVLAGGGGLDPTTLEKLFLPGGRRKEFGLGFGLASMFAAVRQHLGRMRLETSGSSGGVLRIEFPASRSRY